MAADAAGEHDRRWSVARFYLVERDALFARIRDDRDLPRLLWHMTGVSAISGALYGLTVGIYAGGPQPLYNAIKFPGMLLATLALCVLALYMLSSLLGGRVSLRQVTAMVLGAILVTTVLLLSLTPPLGFLMLTSDRNYPLTVFVNLVAIIVAGAAGARFALEATAAVHAGDEQLRARALRLMKAWMALYGLVGMQMLWLFRPYFRETEVFIRPIGEGGSAFTAFGKLVVSLVQSLL